MLKIIPEWAYWIAIAILATAVGGQQLRVSGLKADLAQEQADRSKENSDRMQVALKHKEEISKLKDEHAVNQQILENKNAEKIKKLENDNRASVVLTSQLRDKLSAFSTGGRHPGETDTAAYERTANRLSVVSGLLAESIELVTEGRSIIERRDIEVGRLLEQVKVDRTACSAP